MLVDIDRNDGVGWSALLMLEVRMLLARGQTYQARKIADLLPSAAEAGLPVEEYERRDIQQLINAIDSAQACRHYLALKQLGQVLEAPKRTLQWAGQMWHSRSLAGENDLAGAWAAAERALKISREVAPEAVCWASCFAAEILAKAGEAGTAEQQVLRALSQFVGWGETRGESFAYLSLAIVHEQSGARQESEAAAELAYKTDGSWTGPVIWLARLALEKGDVDRAEGLLRSIPNPTTDAYNLVQALALSREREIPLEAVLRNLELCRMPPSAASIDELQQLLASHPNFPPARESLAWKYLSLGRPDEAKQQLETMIEDSADLQSIAAVRFGLQTYEEEELFEQLFAGFKAPEEAEPAPDVWEVPDVPDIRLVPEVPAEAAPPEAVPAEAAPPEAVPAEAVPAEAAPAEAVPAEAVPAEAAAPAVQQPAAADKRTGLVGQISLFGVPDLIQFFCNSRRTGVIAFSSQSGNAKIRLHEGSLHWATSPGHPSVGEFLGQKEAVTTEQLSLLADDQGDAVGHLVDQGGVDCGKVRQALREMIHLSLKELVDWSDGWFEFDVIRDAAEPRADLLFNAQGILLDVMREMDEERR